MQQLGITGDKEMLLLRRKIANQPAVGGQYVVPGSTALRSFVDQDIVIQAGRAGR